MSRSYPEQRAQIAVVAFLRVALAPPADFWSTPNGGSRDPREAALLKATGTRAGIPDLAVCWPPLDGSGHRIGWIEMKSDKGRLSPEQEAWRLTLTACGHKWALCRSVDEVESALREWGVPLKARTMGWAA